MKLIYSPTSPYARKVQVIAIECGHTLELMADNPLAENAVTAAYNPLSKVPALVLDNGEVLFDSPVICEYLDQLGRTPTFMPSAGDERIAVLRDQALGDGVLDAALNIVMERRRPENERSAFWLERWEQSIRRSLAHMETQIPVRGQRLTLGTITWACALGYLKFRLADLNLTTDRPGFQPWWATFRDRPSFRATAPDLSHW